MSHTNHSRRLPNRLRVEQLEAREVPAVMFAVTGSNHLITFDSANPAAVLTNVAVTGLVAGERITDIDVRPGAGGLYGLSNLDRLYLLNTATGFATQVGAAPGTSAPNVGIDFDPVADRLRVVSNRGENFSVNPLDASLSGTGPSLSYRAGDTFQGQSPRVTAIAYTDTLPGTSFSILYGIDQLRNTLVRISNSLTTGGVVKTVGSLGLDATQTVGFDIDTVTNVGYATVQVSGTAVSLFTAVNLATGATTQIGPIGNNRSITDIAVSVGGNTFSGNTIGTIGTGTIIPALTNPILTPTIPTTSNNLGLVTTPLFNNTTPLFPTLTQPLAGNLFAPTFSTTTTGGLFAPTFSPTTGGSLFAPTFNTPTTGTSLFAPISGMSVLPTTSSFGTGLFPSTTTSFF